MSLRTALSPIMNRLLVAGAGSVALASAYLMEAEGTKYQAYQDTGGVWTICNGYTHGVQAGDTATPSMCADLLTAEVETVAAAVDAMVTVPMSAPRRAALISFCYNVGVGACRRSTLIRKLNATDHTACAEIERWVYVAGRDCRQSRSNCAGIVKRRAAERALCEMEDTPHVANR